MSDDNLPPEFWARADQVIALANKQAEDSTIGKVSSSLLYAAARYNAFNVASSTQNVEDLKRDKEEAIRYFTEQYRKMLQENLDDHIENFANYKLT
jgi:hypothetical protein